MTRQTSLLVRALTGQAVTRTPWWLMRQAGRYLPEYRELRAKADSFVAFCLTPELATEATLQPIRRYGMDAAILFSDILLVPYALGQRVGFDGNGPVLEALGAGELGRLENAASARLDPVLETVQRCRAQLPDETALIGFAGAPWTVATYMVEGGPSKDFRKVKAWAYRDPAGFAALISIIERATIDFLCRQIEAGVEAVQLFDSWAGVLPENGFERWVIDPARRIAAAVKERFPQCAVIGFPRGAGPMYERYAEATGVDAVSVDTALPLAFARDRLQPRVAVQGNLDPVTLLVGGAAMTDAARQIRRQLGGGGFVFNLGHGILPETPPENVAELARLLAEPPGAA
jgi:uroporphyrinogen decarboxylase